MNETVKNFIVPKPNDKKVTVKIVGKTSLICHQFGEKAKKQILAIQTKTPSAGMRPPRTPEMRKQEYEDSVYRTASGFLGFPARNIKNAMVRAAKNVGLLMTDMKTLFWVEPDEGDLICLRVHGKKLKNMDGCRMREDYVRVTRGGVDLRYRAELLEWEMDLTIEYDADALPAETVLNLLRRAGKGGIGEWRPTAPKNPGDFGRFDIAMG